jgi:hypothetical protein
MNFYIINFQALIGDFDSETQYTFNPALVKDAGLVLSNYPIDPLVECSPVHICNTQFKNRVESNYLKFSGFRVIEETKRIHFDSNFRELYIHDDLGLKLWVIEIFGNPGVDDLGVYIIENHRSIICSEIFLKFMFDNNVTNVMGIKIQTSIEDAAKKYFRLLIESNFNYLLPKLFKVEYNIEW